MSKKPKRRASWKRRKPGREKPRLERVGVAEVATVGWLLAVLFLIGCELGGLLAWLLGRGPAAQLAAEYLLVVSLVLGPLALGLLLVVWAGKRIVPPVGLVVLTWVVSLFPWGVYLSLWWRRS